MPLTFTCLDLYSPNANIRVYTGLLWGLIPCYMFNIRKLRARAWQMWAGVKYAWVAASGFEQWKSSPCSRCSISIVVRRANDGVLQANDDKILVNDDEMIVNDGKMIVNDGKMLVNDGEMSIWSYTHFTIINEHLVALAWSTPSFAHLTIIEKLHLLQLWWDCLCDYMESTWIEFRAFFLQILISCK